MTLRHAAQHNIATQGTYKHDLARKQLVLLTIEQLVAIAKGWPQIKLVTTKIFSSRLCMFLMTQHLSKYFHKTEI